MHALFMYGLTYGGCAVSIVRPFYGLLIYIIFAIIRPMSLWGWAIPNRNYSRTIAMAMVVGWLLNGCGNWKLKRSWGITLSFMAFMAWGGLSVMAAPTPSIAWRFMETMLKIFIPFVVGISLITTTYHVRLLAWTLVGSTGFLGFVINERYYLSNINMARDGFDIYGRAMFGAVLIPAIVLSAMLFVFSEKRWQKAIAFACVAFIGHTIILTESRGAILGLCACVPFALYVMPKKPIYFVGLAIVAAFGVELMGPTVRERFMTVFVEAEERDNSAQGRLELWMDCVELILDHPVTGVGPEHFPFHTLQMGWTRAREAHSLWLQTGAEMGIPALVFFALFYSLPFFEASKLYLNGKIGQLEPITKMCMFTAIIGTPGFILAAQFVSLEFLEIPYYIVLLFAGSLKVATFEHQSVPKMIWVPNRVQST